MQGSNVFVTGGFQSPSITFDSITLSNTSAPYQEIFVVKYDVSGNVLWANSTGGTKADGGSVITTDAAGKLYVVGAFTSPIIAFSNNTLTNAMNGSFATSDIFVAKLDVVTGLKENNFNETLAIYPNPNKGEFVISAPKTINKIELFNTLGEKVYSRKINSTSARINAHFLPGVYVVHLSLLNTSLTQKLIIE